MDIISSICHDSENTKYFTEKAAWVLLVMFWQSRQNIEYVSFFRQGQSLYYKLVIITEENEATTPIA